MVGKQYQFSWNTGSALNGLMWLGVGRMANCSEPFKMNRSVSWNARNCRNIWGTIWVCSWLYCMELRTVMLRRRWQQLIRLTNTWCWVRQTCVLCVCVCVSVVCVYVCACLCVCVCVGVWCVCMCMCVCVCVCCVCLWVCVCGVWCVCVCVCNHAMNL